MSSHKPPENINSHNFSSIRFVLFSIHLIHLIILRHIVRWLLGLISAKVNWLSTVRTVRLQLALIDLPFDRLVKAVFVKNMVHVALQLDNSIVVLEVYETNVARLFCKLFACWFIKVSLFQNFPFSCQSVCRSYFFSLLPELLRLFSYYQNEYDYNDETHIIVKTIVNLQVLCFIYHVLTIFHVDMVLLHLFLSCDLNLV